MAQAWESEDIRKQGEDWKKYNDRYNQFSNQSGTLSQKMAADAKAKMDAAKAEADRLRALQGYQTNASGLNQTALQGYQADSTNTKFTPIVQQPQMQQPQYDLTSRLNDLKNAQIANSIAGLDQARNKSVQAINTEKAGIAPQYQGLRNTAQTQSDIKVKNLAEYMANRGSLGAGGNNQIRTSLETVNMNNQSNLYRQEQSALDDIARRITGIEQDYQTGIQQAKAGADVQFIQNTLNELGKLRDYGREDSRNAVMDNRYNTEWNYKTTTDQRDFDYQKQQDQLDRDFQQKSFDAEQKYRNGQITLQQKQQEIDNAFREKEFARGILESDRNAAANEKELAWRKDPNNPANQKINTGTTNTVDDYASNINRLYVQSPNANNDYTASQDSAGIRAYLVELVKAGVDETIIDSLAARYGIK